MVEFALVLPVFLLILGGVVQAGFLLWGSNSLNQVVRDTGRYAATLTCSVADQNTAQTTIFTSILGQTGGPWTNATATVRYLKEDLTPTNTCPADNTTVVWVEVVAAARVPVIFPVIPGGGNIGSSTRFRVEPQP